MPIIQLMGMVNSCALIKNPENSWDQNTSHQRKEGLT